MALKLSAKLRDELGKKVKKLRRQDILPAVVYGYGEKSKPISVGYKEFERIYRTAGKNTFVDLSLGKEMKKVLIHDVVMHPLTSKFISIDFYQPRLDKKMKAKIPLVFVGESEAVKNLGGILVKNVYELEVEALPASLPHEIKVDISRLKNLEDSVKVSDLNVPSDVKIIAGDNDILALVTPPRSEEELAELNKEVTEAVEAVKVVKEEKKEKEAEVSVETPAEQVKK